VLGPRQEDLERLCHLPNPAGGEGGKPAGRTSVRHVAPRRGQPDTGCTYGILLTEQGMPAIGHPGAELVAYDLHSGQDQ